VLSDKAEKNERDLDKGVAKMFKNFRRDQASVRECLAAAGPLLRDDCALLCP
jgi:hypothetical protein